MRVYNVNQVSQSAHSGNKTSFVKTCIYSAVEPKGINYPALMPYNASNEVDPVAGMVGKYVTPLVEEPEEYHKVVDFQIERMMRVVGNDVRILTEQEAILGIEGMDPLDKDTSPGIPYVFKHLRKPDIIDFDEGKIISPLLLRRMRDNTVLLQLGNPMDCVFLTCAKDELRPLDKIKQGKTRAIECCPVDVTILVRQLFGYAISKIQMNPGFHTSIAIGIDCDRDWDGLFQSAVRFADYIIDLDFKGFDSSVSPFMLRRAVEVLCHLSGLDENFCRSIYMCIAFSRHQFKDIQYTVAGGMPSGFACTSLLNSIVNSMNIFYVLNQIYKCGFDVLMANFKVMCYGDDAIILVSRESKNIGSTLCDRIQKEFGKLSMECTAADKGPVKMSPVLHLNFLKRSFSGHRLGRVMPSIDPRTIYSLCAWRRKNASLEDNLNNALWFAFMKSDAFFLELRSLLVTQLEINRKEVNLMTYRQASERVQMLGPPIKL